VGDFSDRILVQRNGKKVVHLSDASQRESTMHKVSGQGKTLIILPAVIPIQSNGGRAIQTINEDGGQSGERNKDSVP